MAAALAEIARFTVKLAPAIDVGMVPTGMRRIIPIVGGTVTGERFSGTIGPIGADWNLIQPDGTMFLSARYMIRTHDGAVVSILNEGWARITATGMAEFKPPSPDDPFYCMIHTRFEAADPRYTWLNQSTFVTEMLPPPSADTVLLILYEMVNEPRAA